MILASFPPNLLFKNGSDSPAQVGCMRQVLWPGALGRPRGIEGRGRWEGGLGRGIHVTTWLIHVDVWQNPLKCCEVISLQLIKKKCIWCLKGLFQINQFQVKLILLNVCVLVFNQRSNYFSLISLCVVTFRLPLGSCLWILEISQIENFSHGVLFSFLINFYWSTVDLQFCVSFRVMESWWFYAGVSFTTVYTVTVRIHSLLTSFSFFKN